MSLSPLIGNFLLSVWLWSITWGIYHIPINILIMFIFFKVILRVATLPALITLFAVHICATVVFVLSMLIVLMRVDYVIPADIYQTDPAMIADALGLAFIYSSLHICFFAFMRQWYRFPLVLVSAITVLSNVLTSLLILFLVPR